VFPAHPTEVVLAGGCGLGSYWKSKEGFGKMGVRDGLSEEVTLALRLRKG
jgi:hypothetical protein